MTLASTPALQCDGLAWYDHENYYWCCGKWPHQWWTLPKKVKRIWLVAHNKPSPSRVKVELQTSFLATVEDKRDWEGMYSKAYYSLESLPKPVYVELWYET